MEKTHTIKHVIRFDKVLVKAIQSGDAARDAAWEYIFHHWSDYFVGTVKRLGGDEEDAKEMIGEVFEPVERALSKNLFRYEAPLQSYVNRAIKYRWYKHLRAKNSLSRAYLDEMSALESEFGNVFEAENMVSFPKPSSATLAEDPFFAECFEMALKALQNELPKKHPIWVAFKVDGLSQKEIADRYKYELQTVKNYVQDSNMFLREWFQSNPDCMN